MRESAARAIGSAYAEETERKARAAAQPERLRLPAGKGIDVCWLPLTRLELSVWRELAEHALEPNVFLEPGFARATAHCRFGQPGALAAYAGTKLVGLLPGQVEGFSRGRPVPLFVAWTHPFAPLSLPLLDRAHAADALAAMLRVMRDLPGAPRAALFPLLPASSVAGELIGLHARLEGKAIRHFRRHARAVFWPQEEVTGMLLSGKKRKELRRQRNRLAELGPVQRETATERNEIRAALDDFLTLEAGGWKGRAGTAAKDETATARFLTEAVLALASEGKARVDRLTLDGAAIAAAITLFSGDRAWFWKIAYDERLAKYSPGVQLTLDLTDDFAAAGRLDQVDSCAVADHPMIDHLWAGRMQLADVLVALNGRLSFEVAAAGEWTRQAMRKLLRR